MTYGYDALYRLTGETITNDAISGSVTYTHDPVGNRLTRTSSLAAVPSTTSAYDANDRLDGNTYDLNGNTTGADGNTYIYDFENRLKQSGGVSMVYDGDGNRVAMTAGGVTTAYLVDTVNPTGYPQVLEELVGGAVQRVYTYGLNRISQSQFLNDAWTASFYGYDGQGSVRYLTDAAGAITDTYTYDAFGNQLAASGTTPNVYRFVGEPFDQTLQLTYLRARYMSPASGRFWTMDRFEGNPFDPPSLHKYLYVAGNPVNLLDPSGLSPSSPTLLMQIVLLLAARGITISARALGSWVHLLIKDDIQKDYPQAQVEFPVPGGGRNGGIGRVDVYFPPNQIFEIKPLGGWENPDTQLNGYIAAAANLPGQFPGGLVRGLRVLNKRISGPFSMIDIHYYTTRPGVIEYDLLPTQLLYATALASLFILGVFMLRAPMLVPVYALAFA